MWLHDCKERLPSNRCGQDNQKTSQIPETRSMLRAARPNISVIGCSVWLSFRHDGAGTGLCRDVKNKGLCEVSWHCTLKGSFIATSSHLTLRRSEFSSTSVSTLFAHANKSNLPRDLPLDCSFEEETDLSVRGRFSSVPQRPPHRAARSTAPLAPRP